MKNKNPHDQNVAGETHIQLENREVKKSRDKNGNKLRDILDEKGNMIWRERLVCNKQGKTTSKVITNITRDKKGRIIKRHDATYDAADELMKRNELFRMWQGKSAKTKKVEYIKSGSLTLKVEEISDYNNNLLSKVKHTVDSYGNILFGQEYDKNNKVIKKISSEIGDDDKIIRTDEHYSGEGERTGRVEIRKFRDKDGYDEFTFDRDGHLIEVASVSKGFDKNGNIISQERRIYDNEEELENDNSNKTIYDEFDAKGNLIYRDESDATGNEKTITHQEFDSSGELISKVEEITRYHNGQMNLFEKVAYGANGITISAVEINNNFDKISGELTDTTETIYSYDPQGDVIGSVKTVKKFANGEQISSVTENYDADGESIVEIEPIELLPESVNNPPSEQLAPAINNNIIESYEPKHNDKGELISSRHVKTTVSDNTQVIVERTYQNSGDDLASEVKTTMDLSGKILSKSENVYDASGKRTSNFSYSSPAHFEVKSDQLVSAMNGFGTLNRAPVVATIGQPNSKVVGITVSGLALPSHSYLA